MVKTSGGQRESEGVVVPVTGAYENASRGKGPHFGRAGGGGKREGMAEITQPTNPYWLTPTDKVQKLQSRLWAAAKQSPGRRFHALYDRVSRSDVLEEAWKRVRANKGAAGIDRMTIAQVEEYGVDRLLAEIQTALHEGSYRPAPVLRRVIPKRDGGRRPLGIPTVKDRVVQQAAKMILEPIYEGDFLSSSYGYRPRLGVTQALEQIRTSFIKGYTQVLEVDIADFFGSLDHRLLEKLLQQRISDRRVLKLLRKWLKAGVMQEGLVQQSVTGTPQGGVISPLLSNIYLHLLDQIWEQEGTGILVRYCDDLVILCRTQQEIEQAEGKLKEILAILLLEPSADKTRRVDLRKGREGFDFLGCHFHARASGKLMEKGVYRYYLHRWPSTRSMKRVRQKVKELTGRNRVGVKDIKVVIDDLNPVLRGWGNFFRTGNAANKFIQIDHYVHARLVRLLVRRYGRNLRPEQVESWTDDWFRDRGLYRLRGTIRYPGAA